MASGGGSPIEVRATAGQLLWALVVRDIGCVLRNPTVLLTVAFVLGFCALVSPGASGLMGGMPALDTFGLAFVVMFSVVQVGGVFALFVIAEERAHGTYEVMARAGVTLPLLVAAKVISGVVLCVVVSVANAAAFGVQDGRLLRFAAVVAVGCIPFLLLSAGCGLLSRDEMKVNAFGFVLVVPCLAPMFGAFVPVAGVVGTATPVGFLVGFGVQALGSSVEALSMNPVALAVSLVLWLGLGVLWARWCIRRTQR